MSKLLSALKSLAMGAGVLLGLVLFATGLHAALSLYWSRVIVITGAILLLAYHIGEFLRKP